jgi:hypothetical protein
MMCYGKASLSTAARPHLNLRPWNVLTVAVDHYLCVRELPFTFRHNRGAKSRSPFIADLTLGGGLRNGRRSA